MVEPSAGRGAFYNLLPVKNRLGFDTDPKCEGIKKQNFFAWKCELPKAKNKIIFIGNPPFGVRGKIALEFIKRSFNFGDTVAYILPLTFRKFLTQKRLPFTARLIHATPLPANSFLLENGRDYKAKTEFQIWTLCNKKFKNKRLISKPPITHSDFKLHQYNGTKTQLKMFDFDFDFAVPCQGYQDYKRRETNAENCEKNKQWMLIKAHNNKIYARLYKLNFDALANVNSTVSPGFRKHDLVRFYTEIYETPK